MQRAMAREYRPGEDFFRRMRMGVLWLFMALFTWKMVNLWLAPA